MVIDLDTTRILPNWNDTFSPVLEKWTQYSTIARPADMELAHSAISRLYTEVFSQVKGLELLTEHPVAVVASSPLEAYLMTADFLLRYWHKDLRIEKSEILSHLLDLADRIAEGLGYPSFEIMRNVAKSAHAKLEDFHDFIQARVSTCVSTPYVIDVVEAASRFMLYLDTPEMRTILEQIDKITTPAIIWKEFLTQSMRDLGDVSREWLLNDQDRIDEMDFSGEDKGEIIDKATQAAFVMDLHLKRPVEYFNGQLNGITVPLETIWALVDAYSSIEEQAMRPPTEGDSPSDEDPLTINPIKDIFEDFFASNAFSFIPLQGMTILIPNPTPFLDENSGIVFYQYADGTDFTVPEATVDLNVDRFRNAAPVRPLPEEEEEEWS